MNTTSKPMARPSGFYFIFISFLVATSLLLFACTDQSNNDTQPDKTITSPPKELDSGIPQAIVGSTESDDDFNNINISRNQYTVDPAFISESLLQPGDGLDMSDPDAPQRRASKKPLNLKPLMRAATPVEDYTLTDSFSLGDATSTKSEAKILSTYFQGKYKFVSAEAALDQAREERSSSRSIYAILESKGYVEDINKYLQNEELNWKPDAKPQFEDSDVDNRTFRRQFLLDYGSHYISAITYGYRIAIRGKITQSDTSSDQKIKAAFKAAFLAGSAEGGISHETKQTLSSSNVELMFAATSGGLYQDGESRPGILTKLDDIIETLEHMKQGKIKIHGAPLEATALTYWNYLPPEFTRSRALLEEHGDEPIPEPFFGVPKGTVIAWNPPASAIKPSPKGDSDRLYPPQGWALCNGEDGTPDLRDRFIRGTIDYTQAGKLAGDDNHGHSASSKATGAKWEAHGGVGSKYEQPKPGHTHGITVKSGTNIPAHVKLVYIIKL